MTLDVGRPAGTRPRWPSGSSIPSAGRPALVREARRTRRLLVMVSLASFLAAGALIVAARRSTAVPAALRGGDGLMIVMDVSSSTLDFSNMIASSLRVLADDPSQRAGLVLASQNAYVALPPETPGSALRGWQRMVSYINEQNHKLAVRAKLDRTPLPNPAPGDYPWVGVFTGGTRLSAGLAVAIQALRSAGIRRGQIVLISDLRDAPEDLPRVSALITRMHELGIELRVVTVGNAARDPKAFSDLGGSRFIVNAADAAYAPASERPPAAEPSATAIVLAGGALAALLALAESFVPLRWSGRLERRQSSRRQGSGRQREALR